MRRRRVRTAVACALGAVAVLAVLVRAGWHPLVAWDAHTDATVHRAALRHGWLVDIARSVTHLGDPAVVTVMAFLLAAVLVRRRRRAAAYVVIVRACAAALSTAVKVVVGRHRPVLAHPLAHATGGSFPSGHALGSAALWGSAAVLLWTARRTAAAVAVALTVPLAVAATRVVLGVHFVTDVAAGLVCGWACAVAASPVLVSRRGSVAPRTSSPSMAADRPR